jgi:hypothetical protein
MLLHNALERLVAGPLLDPHETTFGFSDTRTVAGGVEHGRFKRYCVRDAVSIRGAVSRLATALSGR